MQPDYQITILPAVKSSGKGVKHKADKRAIQSIGNRLGRRGLKLLNFESSSERRESKSELRPYRWPKKLSPKAYVR